MAIHRDAVVEAGWVGVLGKLPVVHSPGAYSDVRGDELCGTAGGGAATPGERATVDVEKDSVVIVADTLWLRCVELCPVDFGRLHRRVDVCRDSSCCRESQG